MTAFLLASGAPVIAGLLPAPPLSRLPLPMFTPQPVYAVAQWVAIQDPLTPLKRTVYAELKRRWPSSRPAHPDRVDTGLTVMYTLGIENQDDLTVNADALFEAVRSVRRQVVQFTNPSSAPSLNSKSA